MIAVYVNLDIIIYMCIYVCAYLVLFISPLLYRVVNTNRLPIL